MSKRRKKYRSGDEPLPEIAPGEAQYLEEIVMRLRRHANALYGDLHDVLKELSSSDALLKQAQAALEELRK